MIEDDLKKTGVELRKHKITKFAVFDRGFITSVETYRPKLKK